MGRRDREIHVGESTVCLHEDNILHATIVGDCDEETAIGIRNAGNTLTCLVEGPVNVLVNFDRAGEASRAARRIFEEMTKHEKTGAVAFVGFHPVARVLASFFMGMLRGQHMRFFKTEEEALDWLGKEKGQ